MSYDDNPSDETRSPRQTQREAAAETTASAPSEHTPSKEHAPKERTPKDSPMERRETAGEIIITDDLDLLLVALPPRIRAALGERGSVNLLEIVLDLGRLPEARYP